MSAILFGAGLAVAGLSATAAGAIIVVNRVIPWLRLRKVRIGK